MIILGSCRGYLSKDEDNQHEVTDWLLVLLGTEGPDT